MPTSSTDTASESDQQTLEKVIEDKVLKQVLGKIEELKTEISDLRRATDSKINTLRGSNALVPWTSIGSGSIATIPTNVPATDDPSLIFKLPQDVYSILATASVRTFPFWISMFVVFGFQYLLLVLLLANQINVNSDNNPLNLPANVETSVRISQVLLVTIALFSQDDLLIGIESLVDEMPNYFRGNVRFMNMTRFQWRMSSVIRLLQGLLNLLAAFKLSIQSETVPDVLLNVLGVGFISNLDNLAFSLSLKGYFGESMKKLTEDVRDVEFHLDSTNNQSSSATLITKLKNSAHIMIAFAVLVWMLIAFSIFAVQQIEGVYSEQDIKIEFGDEVLPFLGLFNGCYKASDANEDASGRLLYEQVGFANGGKFGFCSDFGDGDGGWAFFIGEMGDICEKYIARSGETSTFSLLEAAKTKWYTSDDLPLDYLEITEIKTATSECGQSMFKTSIDTCPSILGFDSLPMSRLLPLNSDSIESRSILDASISHPIYYYGAAEVGSFDLIFFTGRRWIRTQSARIPALGNETSLNETQNFFFVHDGLFNLTDNLRRSWDGGVELVTAVSEIVDAARDQGSPLGLQWYFPRYETTDDTNEGDSWRYLQRNFPLADLARPIETVLTCLHCNDETNPCHYDGECDNESGICDCQHGTEGRLCQIEPLGNGVCNVYFNTAEHQYDGGDCCGGTCVGAQCGEDDLPNPFLNAINFSFRNMTEHWKDTFRGREFAFGVDIDTEELEFDFVPLRYEHCVDPHTALLTIEAEPVVLSNYARFQGIFVRCDGTMYLRMPEFFFRKMDYSGTFSEKVRVPYGTQCDIEFQQAFLPYVELSVLVENQLVPFIQQRQLEFIEGDPEPILSSLAPISFRIPESSCVWNVFVDNSFSISTVTQRNGGMLDLSFGWNEYMSEDNYTRFAEGVQLGSVCERDPDEVLDRFVLWKISKFVHEDLSQNFGGHVCDDPWNEGALSVTCSGRRVNELYFNADGIADSQIAKVIKLTTYVKKLENFRLTNIRNPTPPTGIGLLTKLVLLTSLGLHGEMTSLSSEIGTLTSLSRLRLGDELTSLPSEIGRLTSLASLDLGWNRLTSLPSQIGSMTSLSRLVISDNQLTSLPSEIGSLTLLTYLYPLSNQLTSLPSEIGILTSLPWLDLASNRLTSLPTEIGSLTSLSGLVLESNQLASLPSEIGSLTSLVSLDLSDNQLASIPSEIGSLTVLSWLGVGLNQLTSLPSEIGSLTSLSGLVCESNQLTFLPSEIGRLTSLTELGLSNNRLTSLPSEIRSLGLGLNLGNQLQDTGDGGKCTNIIGWQDDLGDGCGWYEAENECGRAHLYVEADGISANEACCFCGGGTSGVDI